MRWKTVTLLPASLASPRRPAGDPGRIWSFLAAAFSIAAASILVACSQAPSTPAPRALAVQAPTGCPAPTAPAQIEILPFTDGQNTCGFTSNTITSYGQPCKIWQARYPKAEAIYKVSLHAGNALEFRLDLTAPADLALALVGNCGDGNSCIVSSVDVIGSGPEVIPSRTYPPGIYYLYVDAAENGRCGTYNLRVTGTNPAPNLVLNFTALPRPAVAGEILTYTLAVTNQGSLDATGVTVTQTLPPGVAFNQADPGCLNGPANKVVCTVGGLAVNSRVERRVRVRIGPGARGNLISTAEAKANEGDSNPADNQQINNNTPVIARSDLSIVKTASAASVVAGSSLTYTLTVRNAGPSDATSIIVTDSLPAGVTLVSAPNCVSGAGQVTCSIPTIAASASANRVITVIVRPAAGTPLRNTASVRATEPDPGPGVNSVTVSTPVTHI